MHQPRRKEWICQRFDPHHRFENSLKEDDVPESK